MPIVRINERSWGIDLISCINEFIAGKDFQALLYEKVLPLFLPPFANFKKWPKNHNTDVIIHEDDTTQNDCEMSSINTSVSSSVMLI